jgi:hypothetical protein
VNEPLSPDAATALIRKILKEGSVEWLTARHALDELAKDGLTVVDATNVLRAGYVSQAADLIKDTWRYRCETSRMVVVVAFRSETELAVVTAWRKKR